MYDAEQRIVRGLPKMIKAATCPDLQAAFKKHLRETQGQVKSLEQVFKSIGEKPKGNKCEATVGLLEEADEIAADFKGSPAINAALIAAAQKVEHYEIASYGCLVEWAELLDYKKASVLLQETLAQEKNADEVLTEVARMGNNEGAMEEEETTQSNGHRSRTNGHVSARRLETADRR